jgi:hypothetical protein
VKFENSISIRFTELLSLEIILIIPPFPSHWVLLKTELFIIIEVSYSEERAIIPPDELI